MKNSHKINWLSKYIANTLSSNCKRAKTESDLARFSLNNILNNLPRINRQIVAPYASRVLLFL